MPEPSINAFDSFDHLVHMTGKVGILFGDSQIGGAEGQTPCQPSNSSQSNHAHSTIIEERLDCWIFVIVRVILRPYTEHSAVRHEYEGTTRKQCHVVMRLREPSFSAINLIRSVRAFPKGLTRWVHEAPLVKNDNISTNVSVVRAYAHDASGHSQMA